MAMAVVELNPKLDKSFSNNSSSQLKFPFQNLLSEWNNHLQSLVKISTEIYVQASLDTNSANLKYERLEKLLKSSKNKPCDKCSSFEQRFRHFEQVLKSKDELIHTLSKCIPRTHSSYEILTQKAVDSKKVPDDMMNVNNNLDDSITVVESTFVEHPGLQLEKPLRPSSPVMQMSRNKSRSRFKCLSSSRKDLTLFHHDVITQFDCLQRTQFDDCDFNSNQKPSKVAKLEHNIDTKATAENSSSTLFPGTQPICDYNESAVLVPDTIKQKTANVNPIMDFDNNGPIVIIEKSLEKKINVLPSLKNKILDKEENQNIPSENAGDINEQKKIKWSLSKSREPSNDRKFKQTLLTTAPVEKKIDISTLNLRGLTSISASHQQIINEEDKHEIFNPQITSTHCKTDKKDQQLRIPIKENVDVENSFDVLPSNSPEYKYKRDAVRKKSDRRKLTGQECDHCYKFYERERANFGETQVLRMINKCSKHRDRFSIRSNTPPGLWNPTFSDEEN